jgi:hypothetical protein
MNYLFDHINDLFDIDKMLNRLNNYVNNFNLSNKKFINCNDYNKCLKNIATYIYVINGYNMLIDICPYLTNNKNIINKWKNIHKQICQKIYLLYGDKEIYDYLTNLCKNFDNDTTNNNIIFAKLLIYSFQSYGILHKSDLTNLKNSIYSLKNEISKNISVNNNVNLMRNNVNSIYNLYLQKHNLFIQDNNLKNIYNENYNVILDMVVSNVNMFNTIVKTYFNIDIMQYDNIINLINKKKQIQLFELKNALCIIFDIISNKLNISFNKINIHNDEAWNNDITIYELKDNDNVIGHLYFDLYSKSSGIQCLKKSNLSSNNSGVFNSHNQKINNSNYTNILSMPFQYKITSNEKAYLSKAIIFANFSNETSLISFNDIINLVHNIGHAIQHLFSEPIYDVVYHNKNKEIIPMILEYVFVFSNIFKNNIQDNNLYNDLKKTFFIEIAIKILTYCSWSIFEKIIYSNDTFNVLIKNNINETKEHKYQVLNNIYLNIHNKIIKNMNYEEMHYNFIKYISNNSNDNIFTNILNYTYSFIIYKYLLSENIKTDLFKQIDNISIEQFISDNINLKSSLNTYFNMINDIFKLNNNNTKSDEFNDIEFNINEDTLLSNFDNSKNNNVIYEDDDNKTLTTKNIKIKINNKILKNENMFII